MVMPLWDESPLKLPKLPVVTWGLIAANVLVFVFTVAAPDEMQPAILNFAVTPANITGTPINPTPIPPFLTLVSYMFLHANIWHLLGNMIFFWVFGDDIEEAMGSLRFVGFYLASGVAAALIFVACSPHSQQPLVGASGAIAGVLAAYLMFRPARKYWSFCRGFCCGSSCGRWCGSMPSGCWEAGC
jgi:membrane associated rhomboid family serine protease